MIPDTTPGILTFILCLYLDGGLESIVTDRHIVFFREFYWILLVGDLYFGFYFLLGVTDTYTFVHFIYQPYYIDT